MTTDAVVARRRTIEDRIDELIGYDASKRDEVETAYDLFIWYGRPGYHIVWAFGLSVVLLIAIPFAGNVETAILRTVLIIAIQYGVFAISIFRTPDAARRLLLRGCVDLRRASLAVVPIAIVIACLELAVASLFMRLSPGKLPPLQLWVVIFDTAVTVLSVLVAAPVLEEFAFQGWLQTRLRRLGPGAAAALTTIVFLLYHVPRNLVSNVRVGNLAFAAYLRSRTGSLALCMVAHFTNNLVAVGVSAAIAILHHHANG